MKRLGRILKWLGLWLLGSVVLILVIGLIFAPSKDKTAPQPSPPAQPTAVTVATPPATKAAEPEFPAMETALIAAAEHSTVAYANGANDMAKGGTRPNRARAICAALTNLTVRDWTGQVDELTSNGDGKGVLSVRIAPTVTLKTWNNSLSDIQDHTLIEPGTRLFDAAVALKVHQRVRFSGNFIRSTTDCVREGSMTLEGSMTAPEFMFRFSDIGPAQ